ncbi:hypothetical protein FS842_007632 [Serendipita sp. 407]|nr:hypothetical protein FS842_007632 [Serendipita sp. 407]
MSILCKNCKSGYILPGQPKGSLVNPSTESDAYYFSPAIEGETPAIPAGEDSAQVTTGQSSAEPGKKMAVVLLTDIFGLQLKNPKILADNFAKKLGCDVYVPDLFQGRYAVSEAELAPYIPDVPKTTYTIVDRIKHIWILVRSLPRLWVTRPAVGLARTERFIKNLREKRGYSQIGVIGSVSTGVQSLDSPEDQ